MRPSRYESERSQCVRLPVAFLLLLALRSHRSPRPRRWRTCQRRIRVRYRSSTPRRTSDRDHQPGGKPRGIAVAPDGRRLYVSDQTANGLVVVDLAGGAEPMRMQARRFSRRHLRIARTAAGSPRRSRRTTRSLIVDTASLSIAKRVTMKGQEPGARGLESRRQSGST